jgi:hypothetical protein
MGQYLPLPKFLKNSNLAALPGISSVAVPGSELVFTYLDDKATPHPPIPHYPFGCFARYCG